MGSKSLFIEEIGEVNFVKSNKAKNIHIVLEPFELIKVTVPRFVTYEEAKQALYEKKKWILKNKSRLKDVESKKTIFHDDTEFKTRNHELEIERTFTSDIRSRISGNKIKVYIPIAMDIVSDPAQEAIRKGIEQALRKEAKEYLPMRLCTLSIRYQLAFNRVFIKNNKTSWGTCSSDNNINLSLHLMRLPDHLLDYVLLHELAHTIEKNHSKRFWALVDSCTNGNAKALDKELNNHHIDIF